MLPPSYLLLASCLSAEAVTGQFLIAAQVLMSSEASFS